MYQSLTLGALSVCALGISVFAQAQESQAPQANESSVINLRYERFNPLAGEPVIPESLRSAGGQRLWIVQFAGIPTQVGRDALVQLGGQIHGYLPDNAYVVRMPEGAAVAANAQPAIRWVGRYHAAYRIDPALIVALQVGALQAARYNMVVVDKFNDKPALGAKIRGLGGVVTNEHPGSILFTANLTGAQLIKTAHLDEVLWIDAWTPIEDDVNNARIQGGANYVEGQAGYSGNGLNAHIYEGILTSHQAYSGPVINVLSGGASSSHGTQTAGIVFGDGTGNPTFRGFAPDVGKFYTTYNSVTTSRFNVVAELVNNRNVSHTTASWGNARTFFYTSVSADADNIIFTHDICWTQSQSNAGNQDSRPQAWAKNIFSIGGFAHYNNSNVGDDSWQGGNGSTGPAADGRIKPTLAAYYDSIGTTSSNGGYSTSFGGTSGATPIIAGHNLLAIEMFVDDTGHPGIGPFNNQLRSPGASSHINRPHFTTLKALQVASARKYTPTANNNRREHVGWGYPSLQDMWDDRDKTLIVDETDVLTQGNMTRWDTNIAPGQLTFKAVLNYNEPAANPAAAQTLINNLSLKVTAPNGTIYWGNNGLEVGNWSPVGGSEDTVNPIECVFVQNPAPGVWHIDVIATSIVQDNHLETGTLDADYGLVVTGGTAQPPTSAYFVEYGSGCPGSAFTVTPCAQLNQNGGTLVGTTTNLEYGIIPSTNNPMLLTSFEIFTRSTGGNQVVQAAIYPLLGVTPLATTSITVGATPGFYTATFVPPVALSSNYFLAIDVSAGNVVVPNLVGGSTAAVFSRLPSGAWAYDPSVNRPAYRVHCTAGTVFDVPDLANNGNPVLGTSYDITLTDALDSTPAIMMTGFSDAIFNGTPLPAPVPGAPGCNILAAPLATNFTLTSATGTATDTFAVPVSSSFIGLELFHQWAVLDPTANAIGIVVSDAGKAKVGT